MTETEVLRHASQPGACSYNGAPDAAHRAAEARLIVLQDAEYSQETVILWIMTDKGWKKLEMMR